MDVGRSGYITASPSNAPAVSIDDCRLQIADCTWPEQHKQGKYDAAEHPELVEGQAESFCRQRPVVFRHQLETLPCLRRFAHAVRMGTPGRAGAPADTRSVRRHRPRNKVKEPMTRLRPALLVLLMLLLWPTGASAAAPLERGTIAGELVIKLRPGAALSSQALASGPHAADLNRLLRGAGAGVARALVPGDDTYRLRVRPGVDLTALIADLSATPDVAFAEPNHIRTMMRTPNDP